MKHTLCAFHEKEHLQERRYLSGCTNFRTYKSWHCHVPAALKVVLRFDEITLIIVL